MTAWRARIFLLLNAGNIIPFKMMDIHLVSAAYLCLSPEQHDRFAQLGLYTPLSVAKLILRSKLQSAFFLIILLLSIALLCVETDPALTSINFHTIFILECICMVVFVVEICIQLCCIQRKPAQTLRSFMPRFMRKAYRWYLMIHTITFSEKKVQRVITGRDPTPKVFRMDKKCENEQTTGADFSHHSFDRTHLVSPAETSAPPLVYVDSEAKLWTWIFIDIVATLPFFVEVFLNVALTVGSGQTYDWMLIHMYSWRTASDWFFLLRIMRTFRLFKIGQKSERVRIIWRAVTNSLDGIVLLLVTVPLFVLFSSFFLFYAEQASSYVENGVWYYSNGTSSSFQSVADCFWILIETITTVGYGDVIPHTVGGKLVCAIVMFFSLFIVAFPLCMITMQYSHYARLFSEQKRARAEAVHRLHEKLLAADGDVVFKATSASPPGGKGGVDTTLEPFSETPLEALYTNFNQLTSRSLAKIMSFGDARNTSSGSLRTLGALGNIGEAEAPVAPAARRTPLKIVSLFQEPHATSPNADAAKTAEELPSAGVTTAAGLRKASLGPEPPSPRDEIGPVAQGEPAVRKPKSYPSMREIERQVDNVVLEGHPKTVLFKVQDWKLDYKEERREDMLTMRVRCKDEDAYRRLMKILADFS
ncbi:hypothetical protein BC830DRAFT_802054 [Chytriomyces sp. MP71]|nr:hypothetical protein BC830DRAFT_802054 [Chytriomyces sp. MP71]